MYSEGAALSKNALSHPSPSHFHLHMLLQRCGNTHACSLACEPKSQLSFPPRALEMKKGKSKPEQKLMALSTLCMKWSVEESAPGKQQLWVNHQVNVEGQELVSALPACNRGNACHLLQWIGLFINDAWRDFEVCEGSAVAGSENAWRYLFSQAPWPCFPQPKISPKMRGNGRFFLLGLWRTFSASSCTAIKWRISRAVYILGELLLLCFLLSPASTEIFLLK